MAKLKDLIQESIGDKDINSLTNEELLDAIDLTLTNNESFRTYPYSHESCVVDNHFDEDPDPYRFGDGY